MEFPELIEVLKEVNKYQDKSVDPELLEQVMALIIKNPLDQERGTCQDQIIAVINEHCKKGE